MTDQHKAFFLSLALSCIAAVKEHEETLGVKTFRARQMKRCELEVCRATDHYRPERWPVREMRKARKITDRVDKEVKKMFAEGRSSLRILYRASRLRR